MRKWAVSFLVGLFLMSLSPSLAAGEEGAARPALQAALVLPEGSQLDEAELEGVVGEGPITFLNGLLMFAGGIKEMYESGVRGDWLGFGLGAGAFLLGQAEMAMGVILPSP